MGKFNFNESPVKKVAEDIRDNNEQQTLTPNPLPANNEGVNTHSSAPATPAENNTAQPLPSPLSLGEGWGGAPTKGISVKLPYSLYDALDAIKKQTQRTGNPRDKMGIGDLVVLAVKEFVERNGVEQR